MPPRKRYSSSFGHRYTASVGGGAGSEGSAGETDKKDVNTVTAQQPRDRVQSASFLGTTTDDEREISSFVQDIDAAARQPLLSRHRHTVSHPGRLGSGATTIPVAAIAENASARAEGVRSPPSSTSAGSGAEKGGVLTSETEVDKRLQEMTAAFQASLAGLGGDRPTVRRRPPALASNLASGLDVPPGEASGSPSVSSVGAGQTSSASDEVVGRMSLEASSGRGSPASRRAQNPPSQQQRW